MFQFNRENDSEMIDSVLLGKDGQILSRTIDIMASAIGVTLMSTHGWVFLI